MAQQAYKGDVLQKIAGIALILGGVATIVFNILAPRPDDPTSVASSIAALGKNLTLAKLAFFGIAVGIWFIVMGFAGIYRSLTTGAASAWARLGFYGVVVSSAIFTVTFGLFIGAAKAVGLGAAGDAPAAALIIAGNSLFALSATTWWLAVAIEGLAIALGNLYPKWVGWALLVSGAAIVIVSGIPGVFSTPSKSLDLVFAALALITSVLVLILGIWITRREMKAMKAT